MTMPRHKTRGIGNWLIVSLEIPPDIADLLREASTLTGHGVSTIARVCIYDKVRDIVRENKTVAEYMNTHPYRGATTPPTAFPVS